MTAGPRTTAEERHEEKYLGRDGNPNTHGLRRTPLDGATSCQFSWSERANCVSLGRAEADSPSPRNGSQYPVPQIGSRNIPRVLQTGDGECLDHACTTVLSFGEGKAGSGGFVIEIGTARSEER